MLTVYRVPGFDRVTARCRFAQPCVAVYRVPGFDRVTAKQPSKMVLALWCTGCLDLTGLQLPRIQRTGGFRVYRVPGFDRVTAYVLV